MNSKDTPKAQEDRATVYVPVVSPYAEEGVNLYYFWNVIRDYRLSVAGVALACVLLAALLAFVMTPEYEVAVLVAPAEEEQESAGIESLLGQFGGVAAASGLSLNSGGLTNEAIATLKSRSFTEEFIESQNLLPVLFHKHWDADNQEWTTDDVPTLWDGFEKFEKDIRTVSESATTGHVTLTILWKDREQAAEWANVMIHRLNEKLRLSAIAEAEESLEYLNQELGKTSVVELQQAIFRLIERQINVIMLANVRDEYAFKVIDPAMPQDEDEFAKPKRALMILIGLFVGLLFGFFLALVRQFAEEAKTA